MEKIKKSLVALFLAVLFGFTALFGVAGAARPASASAANEDDEEEMIVGISFPDLDFYKRLSDKIKSSVLSQGSQNKCYCGFYEPGASWEQISQIETFLANGINILIVASTEPNSLINILNDIHDHHSVKIIVIGEFNASYPPETFYITQNFYNLGLNHASDIMKNVSLDSDSYVGIVFHSGDTGIDYRNGVYDGLQRVGFAGTTVDLLADDFDGMLMTIEQRIDNGTMYELVEIAAMSSYYAESILNVYYNRGYSDTSPYCGTGIRAISKENDPNYADEYEKEVDDFIDDYFNKIDELMYCLIRGLIPENAIPYYDSFIIEVGFLEGLTKYVEKT